MAEESIRAFYEKAKHHGMLWTLKRLWFVLLRKTVHYEDSTIIFYEIDGKMMPPIHARLEGMTYAWVPEKDQDQVVALKDAQLNAGLIKDHFKNNGRCIGAYHNGRLVGYGWVFIDYFYFPFFDYTLRMKNDTVYVGATYVIPEYRGNGIQPGLFYELCRLLLEENYRYGLGSAIKDNLSSRRGIEKSGPQPYASLRVKKLFGRVITRTETSVG